MTNSQYNKLTVGSSLTALFVLAVFAVLGILPGSARAQSFGQSDVPSVQGRTALAVQIGKVLDVQATSIEVEAKNESKAIGGVLGAAVGAFAARDSSWQGQALAGSLGAFLGNKVATSVSKEMRPAEQVIVRLESGQVLAIVQESNGSPLSVGETVYMVGQYPATRVVRASQLAQSAYR